jgi:hypothetical protein
VGARAAEELEHPSNDRLDILCFVLDDFLPLYVFVEGDTSRYSTSCSEPELEVDLSSI